MKRFLTSFACLASALVSIAQAQNDNAVYRCVGDDGVPTYTNATLGLKGCQVVSGVAVTTIPAFKPNPAAAAPLASTPANGGTGIGNGTGNGNGGVGGAAIAGNGGASFGASSAGAAPATAPRTSTVANVGPADFPRVDSETQRQRDETGRRPILERELRDREERCAATRKDLNGGPARPVGEPELAFAQRVAGMQLQLERCGADLAAIKRELNALK
jgi:hypothetical protein